MAALLLLAISAVIMVAVLSARMFRWFFTFQVLKRMPHVESSGIWGWKEPYLDPAHAPHIMARNAEKLGGIYSWRVLHFVGVVVTDPALAQQVLSTLDLPKSRDEYHAFSTLTSPGGREPNLVSYVQHDARWRAVRKGVAPAFSPKYIRAEFSHVVDLSMEICRILDSEGPGTYLDLDNLLQRESMDVIGRIGFATDFGALRKFKARSSGGEPSVLSGGLGGGLPAHALDPDDVFEVVRAAVDELVRRWIDPLRMYLRHITPDGWRGEAHLRAYQAHMRRLLKEVRARGDPSPDDMSVAAHLLRIRDPHTGQGLTDEQLAGQIGVFFFAGYETTGHTMAWTLYFLSTHPECEAAVCAELDTLGLLVTPSRPHPRPLEYSDLGRLRYLGWAIKESQRLVPVVGQGSPRRGDKPISLGGYTIPAGVTIYVPQQGLHTCSRNWERPQEFDPGRWREAGEEYWPGPIDEGGSRRSPGDEGVQPAGMEREREILEEMEEEGAGGKPPRPPLRFIPFSLGRRDCVGQNLAKMNYTATLALLLARFSFRLPKELEGPGAFWGLQCFRTTTQPVDGLPLRCIPRPS